MSGIESTSSPSLNCDSLTIYRRGFALYDNDNNVWFLNPKKSLTLEQMIIDYDNSYNILIQARIYYTLNKTRNTFQDLEYGRQRDIWILFSTLGSHQEADNGYTIILEEIVKDGKK